MQSGSRHGAPLSRRKRATFALLAVLAGLALPLLVMEVGLRAMGVDPRPVPLREVEVLREGEWQPVGVWGTARLKRPSPYGIAMGEFVPDQDFRFVYFDHAPSSSKTRWITREVHGRINRFGIRGQEPAPVKREDALRILTLGDSFTFGDGVADNETFTAQLQGWLGRENDCLEPSRAVETINAGVPGYNTVDEVTYLERRWLALFDPDLVLLTFYLNDAYDDTRFAQVIRGGAAGTTRDAAESLLWKSRALGWALTRFTRWRLSLETRELYRAQFSDDPELEGHHWGDCRAALDRAAELTRRHGARLAVAIFPDLHQLDEGYPFRAIHEQVRRACEELGIPVLDLLENFEGREPASLWVHPTDHHPNPAAHVLAAAAIGRFLCDRPHLLEPLPEHGPAR